MSLDILFHFLGVQHVSDINISIIKSLRLFCWITTLVVLFLVRCVLEFRCCWFGVVSVLKASVCNTDTLFEFYGQRFFVAVWKLFYCLSWFGSMDKVTKFVIELVQICRCHQSRYDNCECYLSQFLYLRDLFYLFNCLDICTDGEDYCNNYWHIGNRRESNLSHVSYHSNT